MIKELIKLQKKVKLSNLKKGIGYALLSLISLISFAVLISIHHATSVHSIQNLFLTLLSETTMFLLTIKVMQKIAMKSRHEDFLWYFFHKKKLKILDKIVSFFEVEPLSIFDSVNEIDTKSFDLMKQILNFDLKIKIINNENLTDTKKEYDKYMDILLYNKVAISTPFINDDIQKTILKNHKDLYIKCREIVNNLSSQYKTLDNVNFSLSNEEVKKLYTTLKDADNIELEIIKKSKEEKQKICTSMEEKKYLNL